MGEVFCKNKSRLIILICAVFLMLPAVGAQASDRELDLFQKGYEYYLSYRPERATEEFKLFLREFPRSSSKDAVMFWLGKSLVQLKYFEEARKVFSDIKQEVPGSPFIKYAERELESINSRSLAGITPAGSKERGGVKEEQIVASAGFPAAGENAVSTKKNHPAEATSKAGPSETEKRPPTGTEGVKNMPSEKSVVNPEPSVSKEQNGAKKQEVVSNLVGPPLTVKWAESTERKQPGKATIKGGAPPKDEKKLSTGRLMVKKTEPVRIAVKSPAVNEEQGSAKKGQIVAGASLPVAGEKTESAEKKQPGKTTKERTGTVKTERRPSVEPEIAKKTPAEKSMVKASSLSKELSGAKKEQTVPNSAGPHMIAKGVGSPEKKQPEKAVAKGGPPSKDGKKTSAGPKAVKNTSSEKNAGNAAAGNKEGGVKRVQTLAGAGSPVIGEMAASTKKDHPEKTGVKGFIGKDEMRPSAKVGTVDKALQGDKAFNGPAERKNTKEKQGGSEAYADNSAYVLGKLGIKGLPWRSGNLLEDMKNEKILYEEATRLNITADPVELRRLIEKYDFDRGQADYLLKYLAICELIDRKLKDLPGERVVESLVTVYKEGDKYRKIIASSDLQTLAKDGMSFEKIHDLYPDLVRFSVADYRTLDERIREKIRSLSNGQIAVIWSDEGYRILKPVSRQLSFRPLEGAEHPTGERVKLLVGDLLNEFRGGEK